MRLVQLDGLGKAAKFVYVNPDHVSVVEQLGNGTTKLIIGDQAIIVKTDLKTVLERLQHGTKSAF